jgi:NADP-dependent 3-hydroxy acid dehydrogenase YdfG
MSNNIAGKIVVITGASSGLGEATAGFISAEGARATWFPGLSFLGLAARETL